MAAQSDANQTDKPAEVPAPEAPEPEEPAKSHQHNGGIAWHAYIPAAVAVFSLLVALYSLYSSRAAPDVELSMPDRVRVFDGTGIAGLYLQPRFVGTGSNDQVEVITDLRVTLDPPGDGDPITMLWDEQGVWTYDSPSRSLTWTFVADPAPLVVSRTSPQLPTCLFVAPAGWVWQAGDYIVHIAADRETRDDALTGEVTFSVTQEQADTLITEPRMFFEILVAESV